VVTRRQFLQAGGATLLVPSALTSAAVSPPALAAPAIIQATSPVTRVVCAPPERDDDPRYEFFISLIRQTLDLTLNEFGPYDLVLQNEQYSMNRILTQMDRGDGVNIFVRPYDHGLEKRFHFLPFPIMKGLLGNRVSFIRAAEQRRFASVESVADLARLTAGQGSEWADVAILRNAGLQVMTSGSFTGLFLMLAAGRFDYFPRGVNEVLREFRSFAGHVPGLALEQTLLIRYPFDRFPIISRHAPALAERVRIGCSRLVASGQHDALLARHFHQDLLELELPARRILDIPGPYQGIVDVADASLWFDPKSMKPAIVP
jgi:hypothetical protein